MIEEHLREIPRLKEGLSPLLDMRGSQQAHDPVFMDFVTVVVGGGGHSECHIFPLPISSGQRIP